MKLLEAVFLTPLQNSLIGLFSLWIVVGGLYLYGEN